MRSPVRHSGKPVWVALLALVQHRSNLAGFIVKSAVTIWLSIRRGRIEAGGPVGVHAAVAA